MVFFLIHVKFVFNRVFWYIYYIPYEECFLKNDRTMKHWEVYKEEVVFSTKLAMIHLE